MNFEDKIIELKIELPEAKPPVGNYVATKIVKKACEGDLSKVKSCVKLTGFVNSADDYTEQPKVINGASDLIVSIFGDAGIHTRAAVSTNSLPLGVSVEVDAIFELN
jgi:enamine deaminase RidA (YjgF/YER057c/UK114 family)